MNKNDEMNLNSNHSEVGRQLLLSKCCISSKSEYKR